MRQALLVIDMQTCFFAEEPYPFEANEVIVRINALAQAARKASVPVIWVQQENPSAGLPFESQAWQLEPRLKPSLDDQRLRKSTPDAFLRTAFDGSLKAQGIEQLVICGYATEGCVDTTTRRAMSLGYSVLLVSDAHTTLDKPYASGKTIREHHNATLAGLRSFGPSTIPVLASDLRFGT